MRWIDTGVGLLVDQSEKAQDSPDVDARHAGPILASQHVHAVKKTGVVPLRL